MRPINFEGANIFFGPPEGWDRERDGECVVLPVERVDGEHVSLWKPTAAELKQLQAGCFVRLGVFGSQPPVMVSVAAATELPPRSAEREEG